MCSFLFEVIFFGPAAVGILTGLVSVCEDVPSPNNIASLLHIKYDTTIRCMKRISKYKMC